MSVWESSGTWVALHLALIALVALVVNWPVVLIVEQKRAVIVERLGKFHTVLSEGLHFLIPGVDRVRTVVWREYEPHRPGDRTQLRRCRQEQLSCIDLRERVMDFPNQSVITRDNVQLFMHPMLLYKISDPVKVAYEIYDLRHGIEKLVQTTLRSIIGDMGMDDTLASREEINKRMTASLKSILKNWGCELSSVELLEIVPASGSIEAAMHQQLKGERMRRSNVKRADGERIRLKTLAEGNMAAVIAVSKGKMDVQKIVARAEADSKLLLAKAEANALEQIGAELHEFGIDPSDYMVSLKYVEAFTELGTKASKRTIFMPFEAGITGVGGAMFSQ